MLYNHPHAPYRHVLLHLGIYVIGRPSLQSSISHNGSTPTIPLCILGVPLSCCWLFHICHANCTLCRTTPILEIAVCSPSWFLSSFLAVNEPPAAVTLSTLPLSRRSFCPTSRPCIANQAQTKQHVTRSAVLGVVWFGGYVLQRNCCASYVMAES
jgi:hypothetical protein